jgi:hypothetical protein
MWDLYLGLIVCTVKLSFLSDLWMLHRMPWTLLTRSWGLTGMEPLWILQFCLFFGCIHWRGELSCTFCGSQDCNLLDILIRINKIKVCLFCSTLIAYSPKLFDFLHTLSFLFMDFWCVCCYAVRNRRVCCTVLAPSISNLPTWMLYWSIFLFVLCIKLMESFKWLTIAFNLNKSLFEELLIIKVGTLCLLFGN